MKLVSLGCTRMIFSDASAAAFLRSLATVPNALAAIGCAIPSVSANLSSVLRYLPISPSEQTKDG